MNGAFSARQYLLLVLLSSVLLPNYIFLPARNEALGQEAVKALNGEGLQPKFHQLDLNDKASIDRLKNFIQSTYGGLDVLVNNAGLAYKVLVLCLSFCFVRYRKNSHTNVDIKP